MEYFSPRDLNEAYSLLSRYGDTAIPIAGSTFFMSHREELFDEVEAVIDIKHLGLDYISLEKGALKLGATTTLSQIANNELTTSGVFEALGQTVLALDITEVRNVATVGGEICIAGEVDLPTTLLAFDAKVVIGSPNGERIVPLADFHLGYLAIALEANEIVKEVQLPQPPERTGAAFQKFERTAGDLPIVNAAVRLTLSPDDTCRDARIVVGAATAIPIRVPAAEQLLINQKLDVPTLKSAAAATSEIECISDIRASGELRSLWVRCAVEDALAIALARARGDT